MSTSSPQAARALAVPEEPKVNQVEARPSSLHRPPEERGPCAAWGAHRPFELGFKLFREQANAGLRSWSPIHPLKTSRSRRRCCSLPVVSTCSTATRFVRSRAQLLGDGRDECLPCLLLLANKDCRLACSTPNSVCGVFSDIPSPRGSRDELHGKRRRTSKYSFAIRCCGACWGCCSDSSDRCTEVQEL